MTSVEPTAPIFEAKEMAGRILCAQIQTAAGGVGAATIEAAVCEGWEAAGMIGKI